MNNKLTISALIIIVIATFVNASSAATVEDINKLPTQVREGEPVSFDINIKTEEGEKTLTIETSLLPIDDDKPLYDFGKLNQYITENRYNQKITLNLTGDATTIPINITGKVPDGENRIKSQNTDILITKFIDTELKYYEVHTDQGLSGIETFQVIINKKEKFENTLKSIRRPELDSLKSLTNRLFEMGLVTEAQDFADRLSDMKFPGSLQLLGILTIDNDMTLNAIFLIFIAVFFVIGYKLGARRDEEYDS